MRWCMEEGLISRERVCGHCNKPMKFVKCEDSYRTVSNGNVEDKMRGKDTKLKCRYGEEVGSSKAI